MVSDAFDAELGTERNGRVHLRPDLGVDEAGDGPSNHGVGYTIEGKIAADGSSFSAGWRSDPGADEMINVAYDVRGERIS